MRQIAGGQKMPDNIFLDRVCAFEMGDNHGFPMKVACPDKTAGEQHGMVVTGKRKKDFKPAVKFMFGVSVFQKYLFCRRRHVHDRSIME